MAKMVANLHSHGAYSTSNPVKGDALVSSVATHARGDARDLADEMARHDASPVKFVHTGETFRLEDDKGKVAAFIRRMDADVLPWDLRQEL
jgi:hypothetical protein